MSTGLRLTRRSVLALLAATGTGILVPRSVQALWPGHRRRAKHPDPRPDYKADKVLTAGQLGGNQELIELFDGVRAIPHIVDGIRCSCGCADLPGYYSLLTCFETENAMSTWCPICIGTGSLVVRLHGRGRTLAQIREAVDARY